MNLDQADAAAVISTAAMRKSNIFPPVNSSSLTGVTYWAALFEAVINNHKLGVKRPCNRN